jgi:alpha-maltose-1-phosphate synthase
VWIDRHLPRNELTALLTAATAFVCPSVYEPLGIVNLEAMACGTPVVASAVGGIPEVVDDGETGLLIPYDPTRPRHFEHVLAAKVNELLGDLERAERMGETGRSRAVEEFGWDAAARSTLAVYQAARAQR